VALSLVIFRQPIDMLIVSNSRFAINKLKKDLSSEFKMKDLGEAKKVIGMEIERD